MAPSMLSLAVSALLLYPSTHAWLVTQYVQESLSTLLGGTTLSYYTDDGLIYTNTITVSPTVTTPISGLSTTTSTDSYESDLTLVQILVPTGAPVSADTSTSYQSDIYTQYYQEVVLTVPSSCTSSSGVVFTTAIVVDVPSEAYGQIEPASTSTSLVTYSTYTNTYLEYYLSSDAITEASLTSTFTDCYDFYQGYSYTGYSYSGGGYYGAIPTATSYLGPEGTPPTSAGTCNRDEIPIAMNFYKTTWDCSDNVTYVLGEGDAAPHVGSSVWVVVGVALFAAWLPMWGLMGGAA
ncbi:MAG: hypothetical protein M1833_000831 [Piccolia ochrophora]|nr:MAG: hypothetical protein M1833_000831 [Piccolia ochrophora]